MAMVRKKAVAGDVQCRTAGIVSGLPVASFGRKVGKALSEPQPVGDEAGVLWPRYIADEIVLDELELAEQVLRPEVRVELPEDVNWA